MVGHQPDTNGTGETTEESPLLTKQNRQDSGNDSTLEAGVTAQDDEVSDATDTALAAEHSTRECIATLGPVFFGVFFAALGTHIQIKMMCTITRGYRHNINRNPDSTDIIRV